MREILFRGQTSSGKWVEGSLHIEYGETTKDGKRNTDYRILGMRGECRYIIPETVGQYTGLTDKNGKKIFEGDIVKGRHWTSYTNKNPEEYHLWLVDWSERSGLITFTCSPTSSAILSIHDFADLSEIEVIGNIHDNPELLKGGADND